MGSVKVTSTINLNKSTSYDIGFDATAVTISNKKLNFTSEINLDLEVGVDAT